MDKQSTWVRITVLVFLLLTAADLAVCDVLFPATCELESSRNASGTDQAPTPDGCFCCCTHVVPVSVSRIEPHPEVMRAEPVPETRQAESTSSSIFHPPKP